MTMTKIYSAMECGCYYDDVTQYRGLCARHRSWMRNQTREDIDDTDDAYVAHSVSAKVAIAKKPAITTTNTQSSVIKRHHLYTLRLADNRYYVGLTARKDPQWRINQHYSHVGARWTQQYTPEATVEIIDLGHTTKAEAENEENSLTLKYMDIYGMQNVRGGRMTRTSFLWLRTYNRWTSGWWITESIRIGVFLIKSIIIVSLIVYIFSQQ